MYASGDGRLVVRGAYLTLRGWIDRKRQVSRSLNGRLVSRHQDRATVTVMKFAHIGFGVKDLARSKDFYKQIFEALGLPLIDESEQSVRFGEDGRAMFYIHTREAPPGPFHVAFEVGTREAVNEFHRAALTAGGRDNGVPGIRKHYSPTYYAAFVLDPDGHNIEAICRV